MKRILFIVCITATMLQSCKTVELSQIPKREIFSGIDFRTYTKSGFLFSPGDYNGNFEAIGIVSFLIMPEANKKKFEKTPDADQWHDPGAIIKWEVENIDLQNALDGIYKRCIEMGADALVNFKSEVNVEDYTYKVPPFKLEGYRITGFAIKRK